jgi:hypothetical protein
VSQLKAAQGLLKSATKEAGKVAEPSDTLLKAVEARLAKVERENSVVYHERVRACAVVLCKWCDRGENQATIHLYSSSILL